MVGESHDNPKTGWLQLRDSQQDLMTENNFPGFRKQQKHQYKIQTLTLITRLLGNV